VRGFPAAMIPSIVRVNAIWAREDDDVLLASVAQTLDEIAACLEFGRSVNGAQDGRIRPMMAATVTAAHTRETLTALRDAAAQLGNGIQMHVHLHEGEGEDPVERACGKPEIPLLDELGLLDAGLFGAHLIGIDPQSDLAPLVGRRFTFAHCPCSGGAATDPGSQPYPEALGLGVNTGIGLDAHSTDLLENVRLAVFLGRAREHLLVSPVPLVRPSIWDALRSATTHAAAGLGRPDLGRIAAGAAADLCTVDLGARFVGARVAGPAPQNNLLYASGTAIRNVMTAGVWQVRDGRTVIVDEAPIFERRAGVLRRVWDQLEREGFFEPGLVAAGKPDGF